MNTFITLLKLLIFLFVRNLVRSFTSPPQPLHSSVIADLLEDQQIISECENSTSSHEDYEDYESSEGWESFEECGSSDEECEDISEKSLRDFFEHFTP